MPAMNLPTMDIVLVAWIIEQERVLLPFHVLPDNQRNLQLMCFHDEKCRNGPGLQPGEGQYKMIC